MSALGELIRAGRLRAGLTQRDLGARASMPDKPDGVWGTYIGQIERGKRMPPDRLLLRIAEVLELDPYHVLAAANHSRARTETGRQLFALAPLLFLLQDDQGRMPADLPNALRSLIRLHATLQNERHARLRQVLSAVAQVDESRWRMFCNAVAAISATAASEKTGSH